MQMFHGFLAVVFLKPVSPDVSRHSHMFHVSHELSVFVLKSFEVQSMITGVVTAVVVSLG